MNQLVVIEKMAPLEIFGSGRLEDILSKIADEARTQEVDISSDAGRKNVASLAYKIARSKTYLDDLGKKLGEDAKAKLDAINSERKKAREFLDLLKDEVRGPLTSWENSEKNRIAGHEGVIVKIIATGNHVEQNWQLLKQDVVLADISELNALERDWEEFEARAEKEVLAALSKLKTALGNIKKYEAEQAELESLRKAEALRIQNERDEKIAREAAESARLEAERKARAEADRVAVVTENERQQALKEKRFAEDRAANLLKEKELAEKTAKAAVIRAEEEKKIVLEKERQRVEAEKRAADEAERKREANRKHTAKINNEILAAFVTAGASESVAKSIIAAIVSGKVPHAKILY